MPEHLFYSPQAQSDLDEICSYFANELNDPRKGREIVGRILSVTEQIPGHPLRYPPVGSLPFSTELYRFATIGNYLAFFRVVDDAVLVDRILYKRRDFSALLGL
ncbi:MAG: type II toxin-antitoxin system RelE/ParE family toxin [Kiritimatiellae bacterium]|nr:type II toxin-antitoxin system RelE/ParE family toxin [Kiritimatiellia bacterium]